ncbi:putative disease resistance protein RGA1 [Abrus precatorius]|uniref:Disease resistance protein RGA1 n=1 Tax=Abrus precatorius TaxID=3816 RepID=A0A8B8K201_ABRPR|nr:putative disease resistance protein RGA1 [Abrus precatorius]
MAQQIPYAVTSNLIRRLASTDFIEFGQNYDVTEELEELKRTIESINDVLLDADHKQDQIRVRNWIMHFKEVLHRADDLLDDLAIEFMKHSLDEEREKVVTKILYPISSSNLIDFPIQMAEEIKTTRESFDAVVKGMYNLNLCPRSTVVKQIDSGWRETCSFVSETDIIGRDDSKKEIIGLLRQPHEKQKVSVIAIVGLGGLGKTALAQLVYNDLEVQNFFEMKMWVCVSDNFNVKTILKKILESITDGQRQDQSLEKLQKELHKSLSGKKYLLVLDDIWNESHKKWVELKSYLMCGAQDSKILVTTRSEIVTKTMTSTSYPLKSLTEEESWSLLKNIAFEDDFKGVNQNLESMGKEIAKKCRGVPLAVKTLGGLLRGQNKESEWEDVLRGDFWKICEEQEDIMPILRLSYLNLSPEMRQCFAYCSLYPKDWIIFKDELIQLWMAQGYLQCSTDKQHMEDIGNQFVRMFLMNSFFQEARSEYGEIISFKMHDLMHDLAMLVAGNDYCYLDNKAAKVEGRPMHVSLESEAIHLLDSLNASRLRTLIVWSDSYTEQEYLEYFSVISNFKYLRVLKMLPSSFCILPDSVGKLKHLRYLDLGHPFYSSRTLGQISLPKSLSNLILLQTLKFVACEEKSFSEVVSKLVNLRCLEITDDEDDPLSGMAVGLGKLCSLQFLSTFVVGDSQEIKYGTLNELKNLNLRGELKIKHLDRVRDVAVESHDVNLKEKKFLHSLTLDWFDTKHGEICNSDSKQLLENLQPHHNLKILEVNYYPGVVFPNWLSLLTNVVSITLYELTNCHRLPPLERLPSLKSLVIKSLYELEYIYLYEDGFAVTFFPSLESLTLFDSPKLKGWCWRGVDINNSKNSHNLSLPPLFPLLSQLEIIQCPKLTCMPAFPNVEVLDLIYCSAEPFIATLNTMVSTCSHDSSSSAAPLTMLQQLGISDSVNIKAFPKGWMQKLTSLDSLEIKLCESETLEEFANGFKDDTNCLTSLRQITINLCENLKALPDWICNLSSLQHISILDCPKLASLTEGMSRLTNLKIFEVNYSSLLIKECRTETSAVSRQIAYIPQIILNDYEASTGDLFERNASKWSAIGLGWRSRSCAEILLETLLAISLGEFFKSLCVTWTAMAARGRPAGATNELLERMTQVLETLAHNQEAEPAEYRGLSSFTRHNPLKFEGKFDPEGAQR